MDRTSLLKAILAVVLMLSACVALAFRMPLLWTAKAPDDEPVGMLKGRLVFIPAGEAVLGSKEAEANAPREVVVAAFWMGRHEVTVEEYVDYLNAVGDALPAESPQIEYDDGLYRPQKGQADQPATHVNYRDAQAYCDWLSAASGEIVRLPTEDEWEYAARGEIPRARYPWGWGSPDKRACYRAESVRDVGSYAPNPFGLHDMAGNVFEWCTSTTTHAVVRGGSWAERNPQLLRVYTRTHVPQDYRDADVGFRIIVDPS